MTGVDFCFIEQVTKGHDANWLRGSECRHYWESSVGKGGRNWLLAVLLGRGLRGRYQAEVPLRHPQTRGSPLRRGEELLQRLI